MNLSGNTVLITGGASRIGLTFTKRFIEAGAVQLLCAKDGRASCRRQKNIS